MIGTTKRPATPAAAPTAGSAVPAPSAAHAAAPVASAGGRTQARDLYSPDPR
jgi:hypothetical protein